MIPGGSIHIKQLDARPEQRIGIDGGGIQAQVRAPDLSPGVVLPAQVRLVVPAELADQIASMTVGLRMKERAISRIPARGAEMPQRPPGASVRLEGHDPGSVFTSHAHVEDPAWKEYRERLADPSLWDIRGQERDVFDARLLLDPSNMPTGGGVIIEEFAIHMPPTNFPPILDRHGYSSPEGGLVDTETLHEFYVEVCLSSGERLDIPTSRVAFLPSSQPTGRRKEAERPRLYNMDGPKRPNNNKPAWASEGLSSFDIRADWGAMTICPGTTPHLTVALIRTGETELPVSIEVSWHGMRIMEFSRDKMDAETFENLGRDHSIAPILCVKSEERLESERDRKMRKFPWGLSSRMISVKSEVGAPSGMNGNEWTIRLDLPLPYDAMPTFRTTFMQYITELRINLTTAFSPPPEEQTSNRSQLEIDRDNKWIEYALPTSSALPSSGNAVQHPHVVRLPLVIHPATTDLDHSSDPVKHYTDPTASAPVLTKHQGEIVDYPLVGYEIRDEEEHELRRFRYNRSVLSRLPHAGQMWEAVVRSSSDDSQNGV